MSIIKKIFKWSMLVFAMTATCILSSKALNHSEGQEWEERQKTYDLVDREKLLLKRGDALSKQIHELKQSINELHRQLALAKTKYENTNHELISVRMMLLK